MHTRAVLLLSALAVFVFCAHAASQESLPPARDIVERFVEATGGREALAKHNSRRALGQISMPSQGVEGTVELLAARPNLMRLRMTLPGVGEIQTGYDGRIGWSLNPLTGPMLLEGKSLEQTKLDADFDATLHPETRFTTLETVERTTFEGRPAYKIRAVRTSGDEDFEYFDVENGLMLGAMVTRETPMGSVKATHITTDYKEFGGTRIATKIIQRLMGTEQIITLASVEFDTVAKSAFELPPQIQALVK
jgi:outer membrane lipoprotein-sorting protein